MILFQDQLRIWIPQSAGVHIVALGCADSFALKSLRAQLADLESSRLSYLAPICFIFSLLAEAMGVDVFACFPTLTSEWQRDIRCLDQFITTALALCFPQHFSGSLPDNMYSSTLT